MLHRDRAERRQRLGLVRASARSDTDASARAPTRPRRAARACPRSSSRCRAGRDRARDPRDAASAPPRPAARAARPPRPRARRRRGHGRACTATSDRRSSRSPGARRRTAPRRGRPRAPARPRSRHPTSRPNRGRRAACPASAHMSAASAGSNCFPPRLRASAFAASTPPTRCATSMNSPSCASLAASGTRLALEPGRPAAPVPLLVGRAERLERRRRAARAARRASARWPRGAPIMSSTSLRPESANSSPTRKRCSGGLPEPRRRIAAAIARGLVELVVVLARLQRDVVAEPLRLLVRVGVAADVDEQRGVVDDRPRLLVEADALREAQRDQALPQHVLHRLPEAEVDAERERGDELRQPNLRATGSRSPRAEAIPASGRRRQELRVLGCLAPAGQSARRGRGRPAS